MPAVNINDGIVNRIMLRLCNQGLNVDAYRANQRAAQQSWSQVLGFTQLNPASLLKISCESLPLQHYKRRRLDKYALQWVIEIPVSMYSIYLLPEIFGS